MYIYIHRKAFAIRKCNIPTSLDLAEQGKMQKTAVTATRNYFTKLLKDVGS